jgi:Raf kinase inhibitor-like YbhB/YbcL family protein
VEIKLKSSAFSEGNIIPKKYTCNGEDISPPLLWEGVPVEAKSLALICDDPDAPLGIWVHWVVYNLPSSITGLSENQPKTIVLPNGGNQGENDFRKIGYNGPCPPGGIHRYFFKLFALDTILHLESSVTKKKLMEAMTGNILAEGKLMGRYSRH